MHNEKAALSAIFREGNLFLSGNSPNLEIYPREDRPLIDFLNGLVQLGWRITRAAFEGFTLSLDLEKTAPEPPSHSPVFLFHSLYISSHGLPGVQNYNGFTREQQILSEKFKEVMRAEGWRELCTSNQMRTTGHWILSFWTR